MAGCPYHKKNYISMSGDENPKILILGLGNILLRDEGLGVKALEKKLSEVVILAMQPESIKGWSQELSPVIQEKLPHLAALALEELGRLGIGAEKVKGERQIQCKVKGFKAFSLHLAPLI